MLALSGLTVKVFPLKSQSSAVFEEESHGQLKTTVSFSTEAGWLELFQGQQSLKLLVRVKQAGDKGSVVLDRTLAERSELQKGHAPAVAH